MSEYGNLRGDRERACGDTELHSTGESTFEGIEVAGFLEESDPLGDSDWGFVMLEHGACVVDEVGNVLLDGSGNESGDET